MSAVQHLLSQIGDGSWQDMMLSAGNIFFCVTLIPMLRHPERPPLLTCIPTGLALLAGGFVFASLHLWLTALTQTITGLQWLALVFKRPAASSLPAGSDNVGPTRSIWWLFSGAVRHVLKSKNRTAREHPIQGDGPQRVLS
jgi:hypothetical protein